MSGLRQSCRKGCGMGEQLGGVFLMAFLVVAGCFLFLLQRRYCSSSSPSSRAGRNNNDEEEESNNNDDDDDRESYSSSSSPTRRRNLEDRMAEIEKFLPALEWKWNNEKCHCRCCHHQRRRDDDDETTTTAPVEQAATRTARKNQQQQEQQNGQSGSQEDLVVQGGDTKQSSSSASCCCSTKNTSTEGVVGDRDETCCAVCLSPFKEGDVICRSNNNKRGCCGHVFHRACMITWLVEHEECPVCRQKYLVIPPEATPTPAAAAATTTATATEIETPISEFELSSSEASEEA